MDRERKLAAAKALLRERQDRLIDHESRVAEFSSEEVLRLQADVFRLTRFLLMHVGNGSARARGEKRTGH
jgi:hypothetical protein